MRQLIVFVLLFIAFSVQAGNNTESRQMLYDKQTNTYLVSIPKSAFGTNYQFVHNRRLYDFDYIEGGKLYPFNNSYITFTFLPILHIVGEFGYDYQAGTVSLYMPEGEMEQNLNAQLKWRGFTTNIADKHKRNYKIKLSEDKQLLKLRKDNIWILDAGQTDLFRLRNRIATELWNDMAHKPYYSELEPKVLSGVRGQMVELFLNDEYRGVYCLTERMDRKEMKLKKYNSSTGEIHGELWKSEGYDYSLMWNCTEPFDNTIDTWNVFESKYPDVDDLGQTDYSTLWNAIHFVAYSSDETFSKEVAEYFDIPVIVDYYIFLNVLNAFDNVGKNMFWAVYDKTSEKKLTLAVWDLDLTVGSALEKEWISPEYEIIVNLNLIERLRKLNTNHFNEQCYHRYKELRNGVLSTDSVIARYTSYYNDLMLCGAAKREQDKWSGDSDINYQTLNFEHEYAYICEWIEKHMSYLDNHQFKQIDTDIVNIHTNKNRPSIYNLRGQKMDNSHYLPKGIYIKNGRKVIY